MDVHAPINAPVYGLVGHYNNQVRVGTPSINGMRTMKKQGSVNRIANYLK